MRQLRIVALLVIMIACVACVAAVLVGPQLSIDQFVSSNPEAARKIANSMLDYTLPTGYQEQGGRDIGIIKMAFITPGGEDPQFYVRNAILLTTYPSVFGFGEDKFRQELQLALLRSTEEVTTMENKGAGTTTVRGEEVTLEVYESFGNYDIPTRLVFSSLFPGKTGEVMLVFAGPVATWDQTMVDRFIASIK